MMTILYSKILIKLWRTAQQIKMAKNQEMELEDMTVNIDLGTAFQ